MMAVNEDSVCGLKLPSQNEGVGGKETAVDVRTHDEL